MGRRVVSPRRSGAAQLDRGLNRGQNRRVLAIAFAAAALAACGSSEEDVRNGSIAAARGDALYLLREDAPRARKVPGVRGPAVWTPDGEWLAFNTYRPIARG